jgi:hypothetical protein
MRVDWRALGIAVGMIGVVHAQEVRIQDCANMADVAKIAGLHKYQGKPMEDDIQDAIAQMEANSYPADKRAKVIEVITWVYMSEYSGNAAAYQAYLKHCKAP